MVGRAVPGKRITFSTLTKIGQSMRANKWGPRLDGVVARLLSDETQHWLKGGHANWSGTKDLRS